MPTTDLRGRWHRVAGGECASAYPARLELQDARYAGTKDATQGFIIWDAGSYRVESDGVVMIQTATDSQERYRFRLEGDQLSFVDDGGCEFAYERDEDVTAPR
ncbi:MAG: hypothetical protein ABIP93_01410 [Gemmatimonadaceae bacterium]